MLAEKMIEETTTLDTKFYLEKFGKYTEELYRGGLTLPADEICQWIIHSYIMFHQVVRVVCRTSLLNISMDGNCRISEFQYREEARTNSVEHSL